MYATVRCCNAAMTPDLCLIMIMTGATARAQSNHIISYSLGHKCRLSLRSHLPFSVFKGCTNPLIEAAPIQVWKGPYLHEGLFLDSWKTSLARDLFAVWGHGADPRLDATDATRGWVRA